MLRITANTFRTTWVVTRRANVHAASRPLSSLSFATVDPDKISGSNPAQVYNLVNGEWGVAGSNQEIVDPMNGEVFMKVPDTQVSEISPFVKSLAECPKSGLHNPLKKPERYWLYGDVSAKAAEMLGEEDVLHYFARLIQRTSPKSYAQAAGEVKITRRFLQNFSGDQVRFLCRSFGVPGDHAGQQSNGYRWPFGPVACITPFNFPIEIPILQVLGALYMGNKPVLHVDSKVAICTEQFLRMLHACGMPKEDCDFLNCKGPVMNELLLQAEPRNTLFTGSSRVGEKLANDLNGRVRLEDAGFDWKILGPDVHEEDYVAWVCDQDAYACSGQKCSAQSIVFAHENWTKAGIFDKIKTLADRRSLDDLTVGPVLTVTTETMKTHVNNLLNIPGSRVICGGDELENHSIPSVYGAIKPTAVFVPLNELMKEENFGLCTTEIFGPFQVVTEYKDNEIDTVIEATERMSHHLTAAVVSNDLPFQQKVLANTVNGTSYTGIRARTTGAPQNHWFGPAGDPRGAGIGTKEAIQITWSCHREIISDVGPVPTNWTTPKAT